MPARHDAIIIGGGPAGATAARTLAQCGHSVLLWNAPGDERHSLAECLPPSTCKVFRFLRIQDAVDAAGFFRTTGNTVWWDGERIEPYPSGCGYQVLRSQFDRLLLDLARRAGADVRDGKGQWPMPESAPIVLDCSGRAAVAGRMFRAEPNQFRPIRRVALCGVWRDDLAWNLPDPSHTLVEKYPGGWAWSVPLSRQIRHVAFMVESGKPSNYMEELSKTKALRKILGAGRLELPPWGRDASVYTSRQFAEPGLLIAGDAGATIDPLSSFGVKKAMVSGWVAAVVANTCIRKPEMRSAALDFFNRREREVFEAHRRQTARWLGDEPAESDSEDIRRALDELRRMPSLRLRLADGVRVEKRPAIEGTEIVMREALITPGNDTGLDFVANVDLPKLAELAPRHSQAPDLFDAYARARSAVDLPSFLTALATLLARGVLTYNRSQ